MGHEQTLNERIAIARAKLHGRGQAHALRWWPELSDEQRHRLFAELARIPWNAIDPALESVLQGTSGPSRIDPGQIAPAPVFPAEPTADLAPMYGSARTRGAQLLRAGQVAAFTVAGGQGSRLGVDGPKGTVVVTPDGRATLFELFAKTVLAARRRNGSAIPWYIMTSELNHVQTTSFFEQNRFFGLPDSDVMFFPQGMLPAFDLNGRLLMAEKGALALVPDGHGGSLTALARSGALRDMRRRGIEAISYFQVDNPLVRPFDPLFLGLHHLQDSEMSTKVARKAADLEKVGNICLCAGKLTVVEYTEFPEQLAHARNDDGSRRFDAGNLAIHMLAVGFVERLTEGELQLPLRCAVKGMAFLDDRGERVTPNSPNALKLESFVFDALPLARHPVVLEVDRAEEFAPIKNARGVDSLQSARAAQNERACRWLEAAGRYVPRQADGTPQVTVTIAPTFAMDSEQLRFKLGDVPELRPGINISLRGDSELQ